MKNLPRKLASTSTNPRIT